MLVSTSTNELMVAFGGFAGAVPELKHLVENMKLANSLTLDGECLKRWS